jgi:hypothetical protein
MPFHIDKFRGSPAVQAMHPAARIGYLYLLASMWQTDDCTVSSDPLDLAEMSGIGDDLWAQYGPRIMRNLRLLENGRLTNDVLRAEWDEAKRIYEAGQARREELHRKRAEAGGKGADARWQKNDFATEPYGKPIAKNALTGTGTETLGNTPQPPSHEGGKKPTRAERKSAAANVGAFPSTMTEEQEREMQLDVWRSQRNKGSPIYAKEAPKWVQQTLDAEERESA